MGELRELIERARSGQILRLTLGEDRWQLVERMQAAMSLIEGHAEHTMDVIGAEMLPSLPRLRAAMNRRRESRGLPWRVLERLLGLELKMRQYETGRRFCDAVVADGGARRWPTPGRRPRCRAPTSSSSPRWLERMRAAAALTARSGPDDTGPLAERTRRAWTPRPRIGAPTFRPGRIHSSRKVAAERMFLLPQTRPSTARGYRVFTA